MSDLGREAFSHVERIRLASPVANYGHRLGARAEIEGVACALAISHGLVPPTSNYPTPDPICDLDVVPNEPREKELRYVLSNAFGFGGIYSCVVYEQV
jgi:3-oxoacyl-(acyl-carrier-protein) synthase